MFSHFEYFLNFIFIFLWQDALQEVFHQQKNSIKTCDNLLNIKIHKRLPNNIPLFINNYL